MSTVAAARIAVPGIAARASGDARPRAARSTRRVEREKAAAAVQMMGRRATLVVTRATDEKDARTSIDDETVSETVRRRREAAKQGKDNSPTLNPLDLGRRARQLTDGFFKGITGLTQLARSPSIDEAKYDAVYSADLLSGDDLTEYETPNARFTTVLVVGAAGRVGRVLVRKLLLRGYTVKALVRKESDRELLPDKVQAYVGDVSDAKTLELAISGVNKVVYCARAKTFMSSELANVDAEGVRIAAKALQDYNNSLASRRAGRSQKSKQMLYSFAKFRDVFDDWTVDETRLVNPEDGRWQAAAEVAQRIFFDKESDESDSNSSSYPTFSGYVFAKTGVAQISCACDALGSGDAAGAVVLRDHEGVLLRLRGDGKRYSVVLSEGGVEGRTFIAPFATTGKWQIVRIPFSQFRPEVFNRAYNSGGDAEVDAVAPVDLNAIERVGLRFEARNQSRSAGAGTNGGGGGPEWMSELDAPSNNSFELELEYVKALPKGEETDFVLVSCGGAGLPDGEDRDKLVRAKRDGERTLRNSGLGYTIVRPGQLLEEPGGNKALVFDQGNRISNYISCADVADVCVKALHETEARNKSFDVCFEAEVGGAYEKVAMVAGKSNNYLAPALAVLEKNT
jgi:uncharacterized protein YbjT (DUF2867 family)